YRVRNGWSPDIGVIAVCELAEVTTCCLRNSVVAGSICVGSPGAEPADRALHEPRVQFVQLRPGEAESVENTRPEVLDQHVCTPKQADQGFDTRRQLQVERETSLSRVI